MRPPGAPGAGDHDSTDERDIRARYDSTPRSDASWLDAARDYASTSEGHARLTAELEESVSLGDAAGGALLRAALLRGETLQAERSEAARLIASNRPRTLDQDEIMRTRDQFGVPTEQVLRDHAISHVLGALATMDGAENLVFFGGTALSRTLLPMLRLSEDIDLITFGERADTAARMERAIARGLRRSHGPVAWTPSLAAAQGADSAVLRVGERIQIRVQLMTADGYPQWPTERRVLIQRYADAPAASLTTFTPAAFVANKTAAWLDRRTPRDLYDLWALGEHGHIDPAAAQLFRLLGPTNGPVRPWMFETPPSEESWATALGHQGLIRISAAQALSDVRRMWSRVSPAGD
jgi:predicted nucleotidyltransferase component of viral defense system